MVTNVSCVQCWAAANKGGAGVYLSEANAGYLNGVTISNSIIRANKEYGVVMGSGTNVRLDSNQICSNGAASSGVYSGGVVSAGFTDFQITNNVISECGYEGAAGSSPQNYGVYLNTSSVTNNFTITNYRFPSNITGGLLNNATGANRVVANNLNF